MDLPDIVKKTKNLTVFSDGTKIHIRSYKNIVKTKKDLKYLNITEQTYYGNKMIKGIILSFEENPRQIPVKEGHKWWRNDPTLNHIK